VHVERSTGGVWVRYRPWSFRVKVQCRCGLMVRYGGSLDVGSFEMRRGGGFVRCREKKVDLRTTFPLESRADGCMVARVVVHGQ
jgi:hypothetical protein